MNAGLAQWSPVVVLIFVVSSSGELGVARFVSSHGGVYRHRSAFTELAMLG